MRFRALVTTTIALATLVAATATPVQAKPVEPPKEPVAVGYGGAVATVDATATAVGLDVLRRGGNAVDAAVAAAAALGVTEPFSAGIGGGGFLVYYDAKTRRVHTIDGREAAPASMTETTFVDPATGQPYRFDEARISGLSVGVPGTLLTWRDALDRWGTRSLAQLLTPAARVAEDGFTVDETFAGQIAANQAAFGQFSSTSELYLPGGRPPAVGSTFRNPDLAETYRLIARRGTDVFYRGEVGRDLVATVQRPPLAERPTGSWPYPVRPASMTSADLAGYRARFPEPTRSEYRGLEVYGMSTPSSGGTAVGEALNILERFDLRSMTPAQAMHHYLEASALAFADRNRYVGDHTGQGVLRELLDDAYAAERACLVDASAALPKPVAPGVPDGAYGGCQAAPAADVRDDRKSTTNLTVADRWGNVVEYTLTIEATGGNGMVVPGRGFLLNNELTDFNFAPTQGSAADPNLPAPGKRPRSSMSPTIVLADGRPFLAVGTPGGATIITTVLQMLVNRIDLGMSLPEALAAPRASQRNGASTQAEPAFVAEYARGLPPGHAFSPTAEIGAATGIEFLAGGRLLAAAEPVRRGGGAAAVVGRWARP
ncbi:gamma-glutamyltransferase [Micromonospora olivasterospora]|uniref:Glutathione hydrolase proenzyme n=1 Tax=Micromonospora olivasterospora TaxID=1880 RepID=A0A562IGK8_MICOL|nr:gamma-glutamyltransferase [Micromonospora olivasterospora]TWH70080.1 gamma-glutamyltranspeptidase/glutathione hydrolase [Micromonospora olivasterospora]